MAIKTLSYEEMREIILRGESVMHDGMIISRVEDLPSAGDLALATGDPGKVQAVRSDLQAQMDALRAQMDALPAASSAPVDAAGEFDAQMASYADLTKQAATDGYDFTSFGRTAETIRKWYADGKPNPKVRDATTATPLNPEGMGETTANVGQPPTGGTQMGQVPIT